MSDSSTQIQVFILHLHPYWQSTTLILNWRAKCSLFLGSLAQSGNRKQKLFCCSRTHVPIPMVCCSAGVQIHMYMCCPFFIDYVSFTHLSVCTFDCQSRTYTTGLYSLDRSIYICSNISCVTLKCCGLFQLILSLCSTLDFVVFRSHL